MIKLANIFQNGMVLQRRKPIRLWGESDCAQTVSVVLDGRTIAEGIEVDDAFSIELPPQEAAFDVKLSIEGTCDSLTLERVDVGEVWIAGGQSNMEFLMRYDAEGPEQIRAANDPHLRFYDVGEYTFEGERAKTHKDNCEAWDRWLAYTPANAEYFSAVGTYFALQLREHLGVPVAIVGCNWGGTTASAWTDASYLEADPALVPYLDEYAEATKDLDMDAYLKAQEEAQEFLDSPQMVAAMRGAMYGHLGLWDYVKAIPILVKIFGKSVPVGPRSQNAPGCLYRSMVSQIAGFSSRGVIWYQGESDDQKAEVYGNLLTAMISCWRDAWKDDLPFLFVQLAPFGSWLGNTGEKYPVVRSQQELVSKTVPDAYMASIMDAGMKDDIHPKQKRPVGERLALLARGKVYGEDILCDAPEYAGHNVVDGAVAIRFAHVGEGLCIKGGALSALDLTVDGRNVKSFSASVTGDTLTVASSKISSGSVVGVSYAQVGYCVANLYNSACLCAKPFRF